MDNIQSYLAYEGTWYSTFLKDIYTEYMLYVICFNR